jgi:hypothetical protein
MNLAWTIRSPIGALMGYLLSPALGYHSPPGAIPSYSRSGSISCSLAGSSRCSRWGTKYSTAGLGVSGQVIMASSMMFSIRGGGVWLGVYGGGLLPARGGMGMGSVIATGRVLWTYLDLQGKPHLLVPELMLPPFDPHLFPSLNMPAFTGHSARGLDARGMPRLTIVLICGTFALTFCGTYCGLILICLLIQ